MRKIFFILGVYTCLHAQQKNIFYKDAKQKAWVDSVYNSMSQSDRIGQLFMVAAYSNRDIKHKAKILQLIRDQKIGGLIFFQDNPLKQALLTNEYQAAAKVPLLIGIDAEWGLNMRLKNTFRFPWNMTLGAVQNNSLIYQMGVQIAKHCKRIGVNINFAPVVDVNTNPNNPIIGNRSFGSIVKNVAEKGIAIARGMQDQYVITCAKHFPGHGDTNTDSHKTLPTVPYSMSRLEKVELSPFKDLIESKVGGIMIAHLNVPALEPNPKFPTSLSPKVATQLLKNKMGYNGLIVTDALNMKGVADLYKPGEVDLKAFEAGNDILLFSQAVQLGKYKIKQALKRGQLSHKRLEESVKKILNAKYFVGLNRYKAIDLNHLISDLNDYRSKIVNRKLVEKSITVLKNKDSILPIVKLSGKTFAYVGLEEDSGKEFYWILRKYADVKKVTVKYPADTSKLKNYDYVFIGVHKSNKNPWKSHRISTNSKKIIHAIAKCNPHTIVSVFTSPYSLLTLDTSNIGALMMSYQNSQTAQNITPQVIFGALPAEGRLPVSVNQYKAGSGIFYQDIKRLGYAFPEYEGMNSKVLKRIDKIAKKAMEIPATPGMQVLAARNGKVVFEKSYGYLSTRHVQKVSNEDLYDIASITKITATLPFIFKLKEKGVITYDEPIENFIPRARGTNKAKLTLREILAHQAGLQSWIPYYIETIDENSRPKSQYYSKVPTPGFNTKVADGLYIISSYKDSILDKIYRSPLGPKKYKYSDLGYYMLQDFIESQTGKTLNKLANDKIYQPIGAYTTGYLPLNRFERTRIAPTEADNYFRHQVVRGYVHDPGAAMEGGVGGHAGVFSNANDLAKIMQMYLQKGYYGGKRYFQEKTIAEATKYQYRDEDNRRGLGFDKKPLDGIGQACKSAGENIFGHSGFTGGIVWVDPDEKLVYIFLSNRVNQRVDYNLLSTENIREDIFQTLYDSMTTRYTSEK